MSAVKLFNSHKLRIAWSVGWGVVAVLLCVLCVRSYSTCDSLDITGTHQITSLRGICFIDGQFRKSESIVVKAAWGLTWLQLFDRFAPNGVTPIVKGTAVPLWMPILLTIAIAATPWRHWSKQFNLRTLLVATTLIAVFLGIIVWTSGAD